jgi:hypothetical protein
MRQKSAAPRRATPSRRWFFRFLHIGVRELIDKHLSAPAGSATRILGRLSLADAVLSSTINHVSVAPTFPNRLRTNMCSTGPREQF